MIRVGKKKEVKSFYAKRFKNSQKRYVECTCQLSKWKE